MKKYAFITIILLLSFKSNAQYSNFSMELNYPMTIDNNFIGEHYNGIIDLGLAYTFSNLNTWNLGVSLNTSILQNNLNKNVGNPFKLTNYVFQPRLAIIGNSLLMNGFTPTAGIGYAVFIFDVSGSNDGPTNGETDTQSGININLGAAYDLSEQFFAKVQYDFFKTSVSDGLARVNYNSNVNLLKIGVGYRF